MSRIIFWTSTLLALAFLIIPLVLIMPLAFNESSFLTYPIESFSLKWFHEVFVQEQWARSFLNSLNVAIGTTFVALLVGGLAATGVALLSRWLQAVLTALFVSPMVVPSIVIGVAFAYSFGRMGLSGSYWGLVLAHSILAAPLVFLSVMTSLRGLDPDLDRAAASLGASRRNRFISITLPLAAPGFMAGALFAFTTSFDEVVAALFLASPESTTLPVMLFSGLRDRLQPTLVVVALLLSLVSFALLALMHWLQQLGKPAKH